MSNQQQDSPQKDTTSSGKTISRISVSQKALRRSVQQAGGKTVRHARRFVISRIDSIRSAREHIMAWLIAVGVVLLAIFGQFLLSNMYETAKADAAGGTYAEGVVGTIKSLNPLYASTSAEVSASRLLFSSLFKYDEVGALHKDLATKITVSKNAGQYDVVLRRDALWHDGAPVTVDDIIFTIDIIKNPESRVAASLQNNWTDVEVEKIDEHTVRFTLPPYASFPHALTFPILPSHLLADITPSFLEESTFSSMPIGSGPFTLRLLQPASAQTSEAVVHLVANEKYYGGAAHVNRFELHAYATAEDLEEALSGDALSAAVVLGSDVEDIEESRYDKTSHPINNGVYALMNTAQGVFKDKNLRKAIQLSLDNSSIRQAAGDNVPGLYLPFIETQVATAKLPSEPQQDLGKVAELLKKSKWQRVNGIWTKKDTPLAFSLTTTKNSQYERVANEIANQLRNLGMQVTVTVIDDSLPNSNFVGDILQRRNFEMLVYELQIGGDPDVYAYWHSSQAGNTGYNFTSYNNLIADTALVSARDRTNIKLRDTKYASFAKQWLTDAPAIGLYQQVFVYMSKPNVSALTPSSRFVAPANRYSNVNDWTVAKRSVYKTP
jgi:peptide/nickel transport system substrate-binding protein